MSIEKAIRNTIKFVGEENLETVQRHYERVQKMPGSQRVFKRIASAPDIEQLMDYQAEVRFALIFAGLDYEVEIEPLGNKGPDLQITRKGNRANVEVKRFRKVYPGPPELDITNQNAILEEYGNIKRDVKKAFNNILVKFEQTRNSDAIIAIWNDDEDLDELEVGTAVKNICLDANNNHLEVPQNLLFVIYGSKWVSSKNQQLYCFPIHCHHPHHLLWSQELNSSTVSSTVRRAITQD